MSRIAHLTDVHINGRPDRSARLVGALRAAREFEADHLVLTGDLTSRGKREELEELFDRIEREFGMGRTTVVPGNHDAGLGGFDPRVVELGDCQIVPVDTRYERRAPLFRAVGKVGQEQLARLHGACQSCRTKPVLVAMHHGPQWHPWHWLHGLADRQAMLQLLGANPHVAVLCGHDHRVLDLHPRVFVAGSVAHHPDPLRLYDVGAEGIAPIYRAADPGRYWTFGRVQPAMRDGTSPPDTATRHL